MLACVGPAEEADQRGAVAGEGFTFGGAHVVQRPPLGLDGFVSRAHERPEESEN